MKTTVTEEFDAQGNLTKRTTVTEGEYATGGYVGPFTGGGFPSARCTCSKAAWHVACPVHGQSPMPTITVNVDTDATPEQIASQVGWSLRSMS